MTRLPKMNDLAAASLLTLAAWAPSAFAGHLNTVLEASLDGAQEVSADGKMMAGAPQGKATAYVFGIDGDDKTLCYTIVHSSGVAELAMAPGNGRAAHIHEGAKGSNGPVVVNLAWPQDGQAGDCFAESKDGKFPTKEAGIVQRILKNPQNFYINLHNTEFPAGVIRGQLSDTTDHKH
jgi:hypothetical protein